MITATLKHEGARMHYRHLAIPTEQLAKFSQQETARIHNCMPCGIYRKCWACPGLNGGFDDYNSEAWPRVLLYSFWIDIDYDPDPACSYASVQRSYQRIAPYALQYGAHLERQLGGKLMIDGRCAVCRTCTAALDPPQPCAFPEKLRSSLEALGFNVAGISKHLLDHPLDWHIDHGDGRKHIPQQVAVVHGLLTYAEEPPEPLFEPWISEEATAWIQQWRKQA